jgi:general stress protein 26
MTGSKFLSLCGNASVVKDKNKIDQLWSESWRIWFPEGKDSANLVLLKIEPIKGEYWDFSGIMKKVMFAFEAGKALFTGEKLAPVEAGEHAKVTFKSQEASE